MNSFIRIFPSIATWLAVLAGVLPAMAAPPVITNIVMVPGLTIQSDLGTTNQIQFSTNLNSNDWLVLTNVVVTQSPYWIFDVGALAAPQRFYRVIQIPTNDPNVAVSLTISGFPSPQTAGVAGSLTVTARNATGGVAAGYRGTVHFTSTDAAAVLPADYTFTAGDAGAHTFSATLRSAGTRNITATDTTTASITGSQGGIVINPAAAATLVVVGFPSPQTAGVAGSFVVTARDAFGNTATGYTGTVIFSSSDAAATLPVLTAFTAGDAGVKTFTATLRTAGVRSITATDLATPTITGTQSGIVVSPGAAATLLVAGFPSPQTAGVVGAFTVTARDAFGNVATSYTGTVHFTSTDAAATLPANTTFVAADAGVKAFSATLKTAGTRALTATDTVSSTITGTQSGIVISPGAAATLLVAGFPSPQTAGVAGTFTVTARDAFGNTATGYTGTVAFTSTDPAATLPANTAFVAADAGVKAFTATLKTAGTRAITATDTVNAGITGTQSGIVVTPAAAATLLVAGFPSPQTAGVAGTFTVTARDAFGNTATGYTGTVHFTSTDAAATLPANTAFVAADAGVKAFSATLKTAGSRALTATDTVTPAITGTQSSIVVSPAAASTLVVAGFPSPQTAGVVGAFTVTARDAFGNVATSYTGTVAFTSTDPAATLPANTAFVAADAGVKAFTATLKTAGTRAITATDTVSSTITGTQSGIVITPGAATALIVAGFPSPQTAGVAGAFTVTARDAFGNVATSYTGTLHFTSTDAAATLPANTAFVAADAGVKAFTATLKTAGTRALTATDTVTPTITGTQSGIIVSPGAAATLLVAGFPSPQTAGVAGAFTVTARDAFGNVATSYTGTLHFTSTDAAATLPANTAFVAADAGVKAFSATLKTAGTRALTATDTVTPAITGTQSGIVITP